MEFIACSVGHARYYLVLVLRSEALTLFSVFQDPICVMNRKIQLHGFIADFVLSVYYLPPVSVKMWSD